MAGGPPLVRASYGKTVIGGIKRRPEADQTKLFERIGEIRREVRDYGMLEWMPAERFVELVSGIHDTLGAKGAQTFWRENLLLSLERRLLSPLRLGAIAIHGNSPRSLLKMTPQAWELVTKDCGSCRVIDRSPSSVALSFEGLPAVMRVPGMLELWAGGSESCIERMRFIGSARAAGGFSAQGAVEIISEWSGERGGS
jgi:hypothetical protein